MGKIISIGCSITLTCLGAYIIISQFFFAETTWFAFVAGGGLMFAIGGIWLIQDIRGRRPSSE